MLRLLWLLVALLGLVPLRAERVPENEARRAAQTLLNHIGGRCDNPAELVNISETMGLHYLYVFTAAEGYVVLPRDNRVSPVMSFSSEGHVDAQHLPDVFRMKLNDLNECVGHSIEQRLSASEQVANQWEALLSGNIEETRSDETVDPLLSTKWSQDDPFNLQCPSIEVSGEEMRTTTGPVAVAMAQIMKYWKHPKQGNGEHTDNGYENFNLLQYQLSDLYANFGETSYDWAHMRNRYGVLSFATEEEKQAVSTLVKHCGVAVNTLYDYDLEDPRGHYGSYFRSVEDFEDIGTAFSQYFYYKQPTVYYQVNGLSYDDEEWIQRVKDALMADPPRPIFFMQNFVRYVYGEEEYVYEPIGYVVDGYRVLLGTDYMHVNFGTGGLLNSGSFNGGWYAIIQDYPYDVEQRAYFDIEPDSAIITAKAMCNGENIGTIYENKSPKGNSITLTAPDDDHRYTFQNWVKKVGDETVGVSNNRTIQVKVEENAEYHAKYTLTGHQVIVGCSPEEGGTVIDQITGETRVGNNVYQYMDYCRLEAVANPGYAWVKWYRNGAPLDLPNPYYGVHVNEDFTITAHFEASDFTVIAMAAPNTGGSVTGSGTYPASTEVTVTATPTGNHYFRGWMENGVMVSNQASYTFTLSSDRNLIAVFGATTPPIATGNVITNADGSQGVVFYLNPSGTGGTMVALDDVSEGCAWGNATDIYVMNNFTDTHFQYALNDKNGYANTEAIRNQQGTGTGYAADVVDFANGWYLPSANQLRKLYGSFPFIESAIENQGGTLMTENNYWSSTEFSLSDAWNPMFAMGHTSKTSSCRVRAVRDFSFDGNFVISTESSIGSVAVVTHGGIYADGAQATVAATVPSSSGYIFNCWKEDGVEVSKSQVYTFAVHSNRHLVAEFVVGGNIGRVITNADGSKGVVFYTDETGTNGTMVALEDVSEGCAWGDATDIYVMNNFTDTHFQYALNDKNGYANTEAIRNQQGTGTGYAADVVDFANGWYLPSANQLRKLYGALPFIETIIQAEGGSVMTDNNYWSSTEFSLSDAWNPMFAMGHASKTSSCRVRAVRDFSLDGNYDISVTSSIGSVGSVAGGGVYDDGAQVTVLATAPSNSGYVFRCWKENGIVVSESQIYSFLAHSNRNLVAEFVMENSIGCVVTNSDGSKGVVFYTDPSGAKGWMVALDDASEGCPWGDDQNVLSLEDQNPSSVQYMLNDLDGYHNTQVLRGWFMDNPDYAASKVDFANGWYLPSAGQLRKLYAALPLIETAILKEGGTTLTEGGYWSSTECSDANAWSPAFAFGTSSKTSNLRVRAIRDVYIESVEGGDITFVGAINSSWSEVGNWINSNGSLPGLTDDVIIAANCVMNMNATVKSVTIRPRSELTITANHCLNVTESISNSAASRIILVDGAQLVNPTDDVYVSIRKNIYGYGNQPNTSWYTISTPIKEGTAASVLATDSYDLYHYYEQNRYWLNHKEAENDFTRLYCGYGYLYSSQNDRTLIFNGTVRASNSEYYKSITNTASSTPINGFNLIGNPFTNNINISSLSLNETVFTSYYKVKNGSTLLVYTDADQEPIRPAEGFFVYGDAGYVCYNTSSRGEQANGYVRLVLNQCGPSTGSGTAGSGADCLDRAYLKMNEGEALNKAYVERQPSLLYFNCSGQNYAVASQRAQAYNLCFETKVGGVFTIESSLLNTECGYLHLVDRLVGEEVDLLATPSYSFEAAPSDAPNRFVLVLVEGAQPEDYLPSRNRSLLPILPGHTESTNQPAYYEEAYTTQSDNLASGWNWWAPTVQVPVSEIQSALGDNMQEIQSQEGTPSGNVVPGQMFKIQTGAPCTLAVTGVPFTAATVTVNPGCNWFGYIGEAALITQVFNSFTPATGDKIISQDEGFAVFNGTAWEGTLTTLQPGHGYVYYSNASEAKTVVFE